jgi:hypothetical protein
MLGFSGVRPIRESFYSVAGADEAKRKRWLGQMRALGAAAG